MNVILGGDGEALSVGGDSDCGHNTTGTPYQARWSFRQCPMAASSKPNTLHLELSSKTGGKGTSQLDVLLIERKAVSISHSLFPFLTQPGFSNTTL